MSMINSIIKIISAYQLSALKKQGLQIGDGSIIQSPKGIGSEPYLVSISDHVYVTSGVRFITHDGGTSIIRDQERYRKVIKYGRITIHHHCLIGVNVIIAPGVTIGPNSLVAAGAVVYNDVPPGTIVRGNPAKVVARIEDYAEYCLQSTPSYDEDAYRRDKKSELLKHYPYPW